jgi:hypothetical protein
VLTESPPQENVRAMDSNVTIRAVGGDEWRLMRDVRLRALGDSPEAFGASLPDETDMPDAAWIERTKGSARAATRTAFIAEKRGRQGRLRDGSPGPGRSCARRSVRSLGGSGGTRGRSGPGPYRGCHRMGWREERAC